MCLELFLLDSQTAALRSHPDTSATNWRMARWESFGCTGWVLHDVVKRLERLIKVRSTITHTQAATFGEAKWECFWRQRKLEEFMSLEIKSCSFSLSQESVKTSQVLFKHQVMPHRVIYARINTVTPLTAQSSFDLLIELGCSSGSRSREQHCSVSPLKTDLNRWMMTQMSWETTGSGLRLCWYEISVCSLSGLSSCLILSHLRSRF